MTVTDTRKAPGGDSGTCMERYREWLAMAGDDGEIRKELEGLSADPETIRERFGGELRFGTGGLRGLMGAGTGRMNVFVVRRATLGLAEYMKKEGLPPAAAIGYDSRLNSGKFARTAAETLAACGIDAWVYPRLEPTPALSWAVRELGCGAGIMITASHNPAGYNGYKVYGPDGCQITDAAAEGIMGEIRRFGYFDGIPSKEEEKSAGTGRGAVRLIPEEILERFLEKELSCLSGLDLTTEGLRVAYTPLNGTGMECVRRVLHAAGVSELAAVPEQEFPDGHFPTCPYPNPEREDAMELGLRFCESYKPDILLATDPDCDRAGTAVPDGSGGYRRLSGNEMGILLFDFLCRRRIETGTMPKRPVAVTTVVSTQMASAAAERYGVELRRTLTGFKYIGEQIGLLERDGEADRFLFGFEESFGYLTGTHVRDKDAVNACLMICGMAAYYKKKGEAVLQALKRLKDCYGHYEENLLNFDFSGADAVIQMRSIMNRLRGWGITELAGRKVIETVDYLHSGETGLPSSDVLEFRLEDGSRVTVRPSGTEPKIKVYLSLRNAQTDRTCSGCSAAFGDIARELGIAT